jgi:hypothetical protein
MSGRDMPGLWLMQHMTVGRSTDRPSGAIPARDGRMIEHRSRLQYGLEVGVDAVKVAEGLVCLHGGDWYSYPTGAQHLHRGHVRTCCPA